ncbi:MAG: hypothetical protein C0483_05040 [Pirellula sp.]|nr:hypothetical protein [Pirellula sp.]
MFVPHLTRRPLVRWFLAAALLCQVAAVANNKAVAADATDDLFRRDNLVAWCIVPFDAKKRGPEERAAMLEKLGFKHFAYDFRAEHVPTFEAEIEACRRHGVELSAWWFPGSLNADALHILALCKKHNIHPELWISGGGTIPATPEEQKARIAQEAARIRPIAEAAAAQGLKVGLYNHGGWFGEPETQLAIIAELQLPNVGMVYNLHHGHDQVERLAEILQKSLPHLLCVNLNGMVPQGDRQGQKILQLGQGSLDLGVLKTIRASGYRGPIGILGHTQDDAEARLQDNLDGLAWLVPQLDGKPAGPKPTPRTPVPAAKSPETSGASLRSAPATLVNVSTARGVGYVIAGREEYRTPPLRVEVRAKLRGKSGYNILTACEPKSSPRHWELFTMPNSGALTAYLPGRKPDHVRSSVDVCDGKPHDLAMSYETGNVKLFVDGKQVAEERISGDDAKASPKPGDFAVGQLVEGNLRCEGEIESVRLMNAATDALLGSWQFAKSDAVKSDTAKSDTAEVPDLSDRKNPAKRSPASPAASGAAKAPIPPPGVHLKAVDPRLKVTLIDRSPDQVYMGVKVDRDGHVFVGGREGVFVFVSNGDGTFAARREILRFPQDSIIMGLEFKNDDLFVLTCNALYRVPQGRVQREGLKPERILWGLPLDLHVSFHCLAWGPDGDLYITHGDPWLGYGDWNRPDHWGHWVLYSKGSGVRGQGSVGEPGASATGVSAARISKVDPSWRETPYCGQGAVLRMNLETGAIDVIATGLRGPVGLAFNEQGELFTNDNDHESKADQYAPAKLLHVARTGTDFGWPRGWMASKSPDRLDLNEPICDLGRGVPCDLLCYPSRYAPAAWKNRLLMCRWDRHSVTAYDSRTSSTREETVLVGEENCRPVGIAVAGGGGVFVTALYMTGNMAAPYCASDLYYVTTSEPNPVVPKPTGERRILFDPELPRTYDQPPTDEMKRQYWESSKIEEKANSYYSEEERRIAVVAIGERLTRPATHYVPPTELPLFYPNESSFFKRKQKFWGSDDAIDLADVARIGSFTIAQRWKALPHSADEEKLFGLLVTMLDDKSDAVRLQAAYYLSLLNDPRSEPVVELARRDVQLRRLSNTQETSLKEAWIVGPFPDGDDMTLSKSHAPEQGTLDLTTSYSAGTRSLTWDKALATELGWVSATSDTSSDERQSWYVTFRGASDARRQGLLTVNFVGATSVRLNGAAVTDRVPSRNAWIVDLQPGGNEFLIRLQTGPGADAGTVFFGASLQAAGKIELTLPEKLDSAELAARLREASSSGGAQSIAKEFLALDWTQEAAHGDAAAGRRLFGTLGCAKCHAIVPDQKSAGAPSLFEARRRFNVPHLVESMLLPSRQVAEPFRAQQITTDDGLTLTGLVVSESADNVELVLQDASRRTVPKRQIEERTVTTLSPMPQGLVKTPDELRNLLAYLLSEKPTPP